MTSKERMMTLLQSTGLYTLGETSLVQAEMETYAELLDELFLGAEGLLQGLCWDNMQGLYAIKFEQLFGIAPTMVTVDGADETVRKPKVEAMIQRFQITNQSFDEAGFLTALQSFGITATVVQGNGTVTVNITENLNFLTTEEQVEQLIADLLPCGITATVHHPNV